MSPNPLVSVGIPTYNRPAGLRRTLEQMTEQTYPNLEIVVSDNCSPDREVEHVVRAFQDKDARVHYFRQPENIGPANNFKFVLRQASGDYFMWAADDDRWEPFYVKRLVEAFDSLDDSFVAVNFEAQYIDEDSKRYGFFSEGKPFYSFRSDSVIERLKHMLRFNYGNLIYSLFKMRALKERQLVFVKNEIPSLLQVSYQGNWKILPEIGLYKQTNRQTYRQAQWEKCGGILPQRPVSLREARGSYRYHRTALQSIESVLDSLAIESADRVSLKASARRAIWSHLFWLTIRFKVRPF